MAEPLEEVSIVVLDAHGRGLTASGVAVPGALPGERLLIGPDGKQADIIETLDTSTERASPILGGAGAREFLIAARHG